MTTYVAHRMGWYRPPAERVREDFLIIGVAGSGVDWTEVAADQMRVHRQPQRGSMLRGPWALVARVYMPPSVPHGLWTLVPSLIIALEKAEVLRGRQIEALELTLAIDASFPRVQLELDPLPLPGTP